MVENRDIMAKNIQYYMDIHGLSRNDLCDALGFKYTTLREWLKGTAYPRIDKIEMMANYFGIQKKDLVEERSLNPEEESADLLSIVMKDKELLHTIQSYYKLDEKKQHLIRMLIESYSE